MYRKVSGNTTLSIIKNNKYAYTKNIMVLNNKELIFYKLVYSSHCLCMNKIKAETGSSIKEMKG